MVPRIPTLLSDLITKLGVPAIAHPCSRMNNLQEWLTELGETFTYIYWFIIMDITKDTDGQPNEETHKARSGRILSTGAAVSFQLRCPILPAWGCVHQPRRSSPNPRVQECSMAVYTQARQIISSISIPFPLSGEWGWGVVSLVTSPHPEALQEPIKSGLLRTKEAPITQEMLRDLGKLCETLLSPPLLRKLQGL